MSNETDWHQKYLESQAEVRSLRADLATVEAQLAGDLPKASAWLQSKVWRQRAVLDTLNRRVLSQRFRLRVLAEADRDLTREEYLAAKARIEDEQQRERLLDFEPVG
ncbi:MAG TPA: hypothetical protein VJ742_13355 [Nitrososphaera sp.]|nr:hypothetical protein [Nitrososphaera sp.]